MNISAPPGRLLHFVVLACAVWCPGGSDAAEREIIRDPHFQRGFILLSVEPGKRVPYGELTGLAAGESPVWDLCQWSSKAPLLVRQPEHLPGGAIQFKNSVKSVAIAKPGSERADIALGVNGSHELPANRASHGYICCCNRRSKTPPH